MQPDENSHGSAPEPLHGDPSGAFASSELLAGPTPSANVAQPAAAMDKKTVKPARRRQRPKQVIDQPAGPAGVGAGEITSVPSNVHLAQSQSLNAQANQRGSADTLFPWRVDAPEFVPHTALQDEAVLVCGPALAAGPPSSQAKKGKRNKQQQQPRRARPDAANEGNQHEGKEQMSNRNVDDAGDLSGAVESLSAENVPSKQSKKQGGGKQRGQPERELKEDKKQNVNMKENISKQNDKRRKWWKLLQEDDPISLEPISQLRYEPFDLKANDDISVWFDPQILANYLVSSGAFSHPVSRRPITKDDCEALDRHLAACRLKKVGVKEVFEFRERLNDPTERITALREQAAAIMEAVFGGRMTQRAPARSDPRSHEAQRGFQRGYSASNRQPGNVGSQGQSAAGLGRDENFPFLIDDDEDFFPSHSSSSRRREEEEREEFPQLVGTGYIPRPSQPPQCVRRNVSNYVCKLSAEYKERMSIQGVVGCIFFISTAGAKNKKKICNKDIQALFQTSCNIKWIDDTKLYVLVKEVAEEEVIQRLKATPLTVKMEGSSVYRLSELTRAIEANGKYEPKDQRGLSAQRSGSRVRTRWSDVASRLLLPTMGDLRFIVLKLCETFSQSYSEERENVEEEEDDYGTWLQARWSGSVAAASQAPREEAAGQEAATPPPPSSQGPEVEAPVAAEARVPDHWDESWSDVAKNPPADPP